MAGKGASTIVPGGPENLSAIRAGKSGLFGPPPVASPLKFRAAAPNPSQDFRAHAQPRVASQSRCPAVAGTRGAPVRVAQACPPRRGGRRHPLAPRCTWRWQGCCRRRPTTPAPRAAADDVARSIARVCGWALGRHLVAAGASATGEAPVAGRLRQPLHIGERAFGRFEFDVGAGRVDGPALDAIETIASQTAQFLARCQAETEVRREQSSLAARVDERTTELIESNRRLELARLDAENANRAKSAFLATMSHEIRTPMNGVIGMVEVLAETPLGEDQADAVRTIRASAFSLLGLIDDILDFSKIEAGHLDLEQAPVDLTDLVEGLRDVFGLDAAARGVDLRIFIAPDVPEQVRSDATRLRQMLSNLVGNAIKFSGGRAQQPGFVSVRVEMGGAEPQRVCACR